MSLARIKEYGISLTQAKLPQVVVQFESLEDGKTYTWWGSLKGDARQWTLKALLTMGFDGDSLEPLADGMAGGAFNHLQEYDIQIETKPDQSGTPRTRVAWINLPGTGAIKGKLEAPDAIAALKQLGSLKGDILAVKKGMPQAPAAKSTVVTDEVPF